MTSGLTVTDVDLLPCPFCGGGSEVSWYARGGVPEPAGYYIECCSCSAGGESFDIHGDMPNSASYATAKAIAAWNTRADATAPLVEALRMAHRHIQHQAAWIGKQNAGYSFEALGEDMPTIEAALAPYKATTHD